MIATNGATVAPLPASLKQIATGFLPLMERTSAKVQGNLYWSTTGAFKVVHTVLAVVSVGLAVAAWIAGFDVIYALLDVDFDRAAGIESVPARIGAPRSCAGASLASSPASTQPASPP